MPINILNIPKLSMLLTTKITSVCVLVLISVTSLSQRSSDCINAVDFVDSLGQFNIYKGYGQQLEIKGHKLSNEHFFTREHNTTWVRLTFTTDATFSFELIPKFPEDDFDFIVFASFGAATCAQIAKKSPLPLRSNLSRVNPEMGSVTGLRLGSENNFAPAGASPNFSKPIEVLKGDTLYIVFDSPYGNKGGFDINNTTSYSNTATSITSDTLNEQFFPDTLYEPAMTLRIIDDLGDIVPNPFVILKVGVKKVVKFETNNIGELILRDEIKGRKGAMIVTQNDYLQRSFPIEWDGISDTIVTCQIEKIKIGSKLQFENINFAPNSSQILPESKNELEDLRTFLINNTHIFVEIGGHVNSAKRRNTIKLKKLSNARARVIYEYLIENGVNSEKIAYKGYGNSKLIHVNPSSEKQNKENRRVEVMVTKINN